MPAYREWNCPSTEKPPAAPLFVHYGSHAKKGLVVSKAATATASSTLKGKDSWQAGSTTEKSQDGWLVQDSLAQGIIHTGGTFAPPPAGCGYASTTDGETTDAKQPDEVYTSADPTLKRTINGEISQGNEEVYFKAMSNLQLLKNWRLLPLHLELAVRRLKWLQSIASQPSANEQFAAAVFGRIEVNGANWSRCIRSLKDDGSINRADANSNLLKFEEALLTYEGISGTENFFALWDHYQRSWRALLLSKPLQTQLCALDPRIPCAAFERGLLDTATKDHLAEGTEEEHAWGCTLS